MTAMNANLSSVLWRANDGSDLNNISERARAQRALARWVAVAAAIAF